MPVGVSRTSAAPPRLRGRPQHEAPIIGIVPGEETTLLPSAPRRQCPRGLGLPDRRLSIRVDGKNAARDHIKLLARLRATHGFGSLDDWMVSALAHPPAAAATVVPPPADQVTPTAAVVTAAVPKDPAVQVAPTAANATAAVSEEPADQVTPTAADVTAAVPEEVVEQHVLARLRLEMGAFYMPTKGVHLRGEDAHFISKALGAFGVADGVSSWSDHGIDAGEFARQLMSLCEAELEAASYRRVTAGTGTVLEGVLERAVARTTARGTSTACIAVVDGRLLHAVNVGDSGFLVVRGDKVVYHSPSEQRSFNKPYQVGGVDRSYPPECASRLCVEIERGDIIVAGSDGLFDNMFDAEILELLARAKLVTLTEMACALGWAAVKASAVGERETPYSVACREAKFSWSGGKPDDVTVVVARVY